MVDEWQETTLGDVIDIKHGMAFQGEFFHDEPRGDILLTPGNFAIGGGFKGDKLKYYEGPVPAEFILAEGDLLITMTDLSRNADTLGYSAFVPARPDGRRYLHNQRLGKVTVKDPECIDVDYLHYLMRGHEYRQELLGSATGTTVKHTSPERIKRFCFLRPRLAEQRAIAHILGTLDDKIELNRRMNQTLEAMAQALFKSWFVDFEPFRDLGMQDSPLGEIPVGWEVGALGQIATIKMGQSPPGDTYNEIGEGIPFYQGIRDFGFRFPWHRVYCTGANRFADACDVLLSVRAPVGRLNIAGEKCAIGRGVSALRLNEGHQSYLYYLLDNATSRWETFNAEGTVFGCITKRDIADFRIVIPPVPIVARFQSLAGSMDQLVWNDEQESHTLAEIRDALLPKLLAGEIRVRAAEEFVEEQV